MRFLEVAFGAIFLISFMPHSPCAAVDVSKSTGNLSFSDGLGHTMPYRLYLPAGYDPSAATTYPLIMFLHGSGESGTDNTAPDNWYIDNLYNAAQQKSGYPGAQKSFLLVPQTQWGWSDYGPGNDYGQKLALDILDQISSTYSVDTRRLYVTGLSMGGGGTFDMIQNYPDKFAAAAPQSGWGDTSKASVIKDIPIWNFHGDADTVVSVKYSDEMYDAIEAAGGHMEYTRAPGVGHTWWDKFYDGTSFTNSKGETLYQWMFSKSLPVPEPASISLVLAAAGFGLLFGIRRRLGVKR